MRTNQYAFVLVTQIVVIFALLSVGAAKVADLSADLGTTSQSSNPAPAPAAPGAPGVGGLGADGRGVDGLQEYLSR